MSKRFPMSLAAITLALAAGPAAASDLHLVARMAIEGGGARLAKVTMTDGSTQSLSAGGLFGIGAGLVYMPTGTPVAFEATLGYKVDDVTASNGQLKFARWPIEFLASYVAERHRIGGGLAYHTSPTYTCDIGGFCSDKVTFDNSVGAVVQYGYGDYGGRFVWDVGARITFITYRGSGLNSVSGNSVGGFVSFGF